MRHISRNNLLILTFFILIYLLYFYISSDSRISIINIFIFGIASIFALLGFKDIYKNNITLSNIFLVSYFTALSLNNIYISQLQTQKNLQDLYFYFSGPLLFFLILHTKFRIINSPKIYFPKIYLNIDLFIITILIIFCIIRIYIFSITGMRLLAMSDFSRKFVIPGYSGLLAALGWLLLMMLPEIKKRFLKLLIIFVILVSCVANFKRGDLMRTLIFLILLFIYQNHKKLRLKYIIIGFMTIIMTFTIFGEYRQKMRGSTISQTELLESSIDNKYINWIYSYYPLNFDVLKIYYKDNNYYYEFNQITRPFYRLFGIRDDVKNFIESEGLNGYNAATFLSLYIRDFGFLYIIELCILGVIIKIFDIIIVNNTMTGGYVFLLMLTICTVFGDYYLTPNFFWSLLIYILINKVFTFKKNINNLYH